MSGDKSVHFSGLVTHETTGPAFAKARKIYASEFSDKELARGAKISDLRLKAMLRETHDPSYRQPKLSDLLSIAKFLKDDGADFLSHILKEAGFGAFILPDPEGGDLARLAPEVAEASADLTSGALRGDNVVGFDTASTLIRAGKQLAANEAAKTGQGDLFRRRAVG